MQAAYYLGNKSFQLKEGESIPPKEGYVQLKVAYCGVCGTDVHIYHGAMDKRVQIPQVIGHEVSATVTALGQNVKGINPGDRVAVRPLQRGAVDPSDHGQHHIGKNLKFIGIDTAGGMQTYWNVPAYTLHILPEKLSLRLGALIEPLAVACHDVRLSQLKAGEHALVIGGGPIGILVAMVARQKGAKVLISEVNEHRLKLSREMGFETVNPLQESLEEKIYAFSAAAMADVAFEVSGTQAGVEAMTQVLRARGRAVMVAIHPQPRQVDLFRFFWRELQLIGVRVYEAEDFEEAIQLAADGALALEKLITQISPLSDIQKVFETIDRNPAGMKYLLQI